jgi:hypothetical protein
LRILLSDTAAERHGDAIRAAAPEAELVPVPPEGPPPDTAGVAIAFLSRDLFVGGTRHRLAPRFLRFVDLVLAAPDLRWVQGFSAGTDLHVYQDMLARGLLLTSAAGASAPTVAQTAIAGLLALARGFPRIAAAQRRREWRPLSREGPNRVTSPAKPPSWSAPGRSARRSAGCAAPSACALSASGGTQRPGCRRASTRFQASPACRRRCRVPIGWSSPAR